MASDDNGEKTEQPTDHRREEERRRGNVAHSSELNIAGHLLTTAGLLFGLGASLVEAVARLMRNSLTTAADRTGDRGTVLAQFESLAEWSAENALPWLAILLVSATGVNLAQVGFLLSTEKLNLNFNAINPVNGMQRILSVRSLVTLAISLGKLTLLFAVAAWFAWVELPVFMQLATAEVSTTFVTIGSSVVKLAMLLASVLLIIGVTDYSFQKWKYERDIRMSMEELKREMKDMDGDPLIRRRRREAHQKLVEARDLSSIPLATFLTANPTHYAIAFRYEPPEFPVPTVIAKGTDNLALEMRQIAADHGIPVIERPELTRQMYPNLRVGQGIPVELYDVFIEILKYVYTITGKSIDEVRPDAVT